MSELSVRDRAVADYVTVGLSIGLPWEAARAVAKSIVAGHERAEATP